MSQLKEFLDTIKIEHTIFALPFAYMTLFLVERGWPEMANFVWITVAMVSGRTLGMAANRAIDARIDAGNPRTASRALPAGRISMTAVIAFMVVALVVFLIAVYQLAPLCRRLWPVVIAAMVVYPYTKRFTPMAHGFLAVVYFMVPTAVWVAVTNGVTGGAIALGVAAGLWVAGFDIIYACQDAEVDRREGLHSIPADFGLVRALWVARIFHVGFLGSLCVAGILLDAGILYFVGLAVTTLLLAYEHRLVSPDDFSRVDAAFFTTNGVVSIALFVLVAIDTLITR